MKKIFIYNQAIWLCIIITFLGCNKSSDSYFPLHEGYNWEYQEVLGDENSNIIIKNMSSYKLDGKLVTPQQVKGVNGNNILQFISEDQRGIFLYAMQTPDMETPKVLEKITYIIPYPIKVGNTRHEETMTTLLNRNVSISLTDSIESLNETVEVPAGIFHNCLKIISFGTTKKQALIYGIATINVKNISWYAPGVGLIKGIDKEESNSFIYGSGEIVAQLISFKKK